MRRKIINETDMITNESFNLLYNRNYRIRHLKSSIYISKNNVLISYYYRNVAN